jgi:dTDP-4-amino-4,6-dideoxygalactose transaminase
LKLVFDAAHAFACSYRGRMIGQFGDAEVFSFHATKFFNTFEGGAVVTNSDEVASRVRVMRDFGFAGYDTVIDIGTNGKMSELSAAMGLTGLESLDEFIDVNYRNFKQYEAELQGIAGVHLMTYNEVEKCNYQYIVLEIDETYSRITRDELLGVLHAENVLARRYFYPGCHRMRPYRLYDPHAGIRLTNTEYLSERVLSLPTGTAVGQAAVSIICRLIRLAIENGEELGSRLKAAADTIV